MLLVSMGNPDHYTGHSLLISIGETLFKSSKCLDLEKTKKSLQKLFLTTHGKIVGL